MTREDVQAGMWGLLVGDACGVPYECCTPSRLPAWEALEMEPPPGFPRRYAEVKTGTWSDDGAQALCLYASLQACGHYHPHDFARRLIRWHDEGYAAVDGYVFDIGNQTSVALGRLKRGMPTSEAGLAGERNNGNGSLMRCLPLALLHRGNHTALVVDAHRQSRLTHAHPRAQVCCALYCLWARHVVSQTPHPWPAAIAELRRIYAADPLSLRELDEHVRPDQPFEGRGSGYVVDCLHSARWACEGESYESTIKRAISLGHDTDTTAAVAGGIAGLRFGLEAIPRRWREVLRGGGLLRRWGLAGG